jgi:hypothetical protein
MLMNLMYEGVSSVHMAQCSVKWKAVSTTGIGHSNSVKWGKFLIQLNDFVSQERLRSMVLDGKYKGPTGATLSCRSGLAVWSLNLYSGNTELEPQLRCLRYLLAFFSVECDNSRILQIDHARLFKSLGIFSSTGVSELVSTQLA